MKKQYCKCGHGKSEHKIPNQCSGDKIKDERGAVMQQLVRCDCQKFVAKN